MNICFLPGSLCDERVFADQIKAAAAAGHTCTVADLTLTSTIEEMAHSVVETTEPGVILIGISLGAIVAAEIVAQAPDHVAGIALLDTNLDAPKQDQLETRRGWERSVRAGEFARIVADHLTETLTVFPLRHSEFIFDMAMTVGPAGFLSQNAALLKRRDRRDDLANFSGPALVLSGADDHFCPPALHADLATRIPGASLQVIADAGHLSTIDQPADCTRALVEWLEICNKQIITQEGPNEYQRA